jgi:hypothetical protein
MSEPLAPFGNLLATDSSLAEHLLHSGRDAFARFQTTEIHTSLIQPNIQHASRFRIATQSCGDSTPA